MTDTPQNSVFIVHGRDRRRNSFFFQLIRALDINALEFETLVNRSGGAAPYIGNVLATAFADATAVVVLLTGDDRVSLRSELRTAADPDEENDPSYQPRPNVIFEAGMALAMHPERTVIVEVPPVRRISDLEGRHFVRFSSGAPDERNNLAERLKAAGCTPNRSGRSWLEIEYPL